MRWTVWLVLVGCTPSVCPSGESPADCPVDDAMASVELDVPPLPDRAQWLDAVGLAPCEQAVEAGDRLDLGAGCADGVCAGDPYETTSAWGTPLETYAYYYEGRHWVECNFSDSTGGIYALVDDADADGRADPDETIAILDVGSLYSGASPEGLGLQVDLGCFVWALGPPDEAGVHTGEPDEVSVLRWTDPPLEVRDAWVGSSGFSMPDERSDRLRLFAE